MAGRLVCVEIPYKDFKEKIRITKENKEHKIEIYNDFILVSFGGKEKMSTQKMLEEALIYFGAEDIVTIMLSHKRDKEVAEEQKKIFESYKESNNVLIICN